LIFDRIAGDEHIDLRADSSRSLGHSPLTKSDIAKYISPPRNFRDGMQALAEFAGSRDKPRPETHRVAPDFPGGKNQRDSP